MEILPSTWIMLLVGSAVFGFAMTHRKPGDAVFSLWIISIVLVYHIYAIMYFSFSIFGIATLILQTVNIHLYTMPLIVFLNRKVALAFAILWNSPVWLFIIEGESGRSSVFGDDILVLVTEFLLIIYAIIISIYTFLVLIEKKKPAGGQGR